MALLTTALKSALKAALATALTLTTVVGGAYAALWVGDRDHSSLIAAESTPHAPAPSWSPATPAPTTPTAPSASPSPDHRLGPDDRGVRVRELQARLFQLAWLPELTTGRYDDATRQAVAGFQGKRGWPATGRVDERTWRRLVAMTRYDADARPALQHPAPRAGAVRRGRRRR
ncbi:MAG: peptidoglycan-binding domain-containing protein [Nocardioides sp.]